jgi:hypothetical protein
MNKNKNTKENRKIYSVIFFAFVLFVSLGIFSSTAQAAVTASSSARSDFDDIVVGGTAVVSRYSNNIGGSYSEAQAFDAWDFSAYDFVQEGGPGVYDVALGSYQNTSASYANFNSSSTGGTDTGGLIKTTGNSQTANVNDEHSARSWAWMTQVYKVVSGGTVTFSSKYNSDSIDINAIDGYGWGATFANMRMRYWDSTYGLFTEGIFTGFGLGWIDYSPPVYASSAVNSGTIDHSTFSSPSQSKNISVSKTVNAGDVIFIGVGSLAAVSVYQDVASSCLLPWGGTIASGLSVDAYSVASPPCGSSCSKEVRTCNDGVLSGSYVNQTCSVQICSIPTLTFSASPNPIDAGNSTTLTWYTQNVTSCLATNGWSGAKEATNGTHTASIFPASTTTYDLECWDDSSISTGIRTVTVTVNPCVPTYSNYSCTQSVDIDCSLPENCGGLATTTAICSAIDSCTSLPDFRPNAECALAGVACSSSTSVCPACLNRDTNWKEVTP